MGFGCGTGVARAFRIRTSHQATECTATTPQTAVCSGARHKKNSSKEPLNDNIIQVVHCWVACHGLCYRLPAHPGCCSNIMCC
jgi:hypothetical protein